MPDGSARLLRQRHGHHLSPLKIRFHGQSGENILSSGLDSCLMSFSIEHDSKNKSLGRASFNKIETKKSGLKLDEHKMPPIIDFDSDESKQSDWDSIICIHQGLRLATTWDYIKSTMGKYKIDNERFSNVENRHLNVVSTVSTSRLFFSFNCNSEVSILKTKSAAQLQVVEISASLVTHRVTLTCTTCNQANLEPHMAKQAVKHILWLYFELKSFNFYN